eukprot:s2101_g1.t1
MAPKFSKYPDPFQGKKPPRDVMKAGYKHGYSKKPNVQDAPPASSSDRPAGNPDDGDEPDSSGNSSQIVPALEMVVGMAVMAVETAEMAVETAEMAVEMTMMMTQVMNHQEEGFKPSLVGSSRVELEQFLAETKALTDMARMRVNEMYRQTPHVVIATYMYGDTEIETKEVAVNRSRRLTMLGVKKVILTEFEQMAHPTFYRFQLMRRDSWIDMDKGMHRRTVSTQFGRTAFIKFNLTGLAGGAKTVKKDGALKAKLYKNTKQVEANNIKEIAMERGQKVSPSVLEGHQAMAQLMMKVDGLLRGSAETSGSVILQEVVKCCHDTSQLQMVLDSADKKKSRTCSIDTRIRNMAKHMGGADVLQALALKESVDALLDAYQSSIHHAFLKAQSEDETFDISSVKKMIEYQMAFLHGRSSSSTPAVPDGSDGADALTTALEGMSIG